MLSTVITFTDIVHSDYMAQFPDDDDDDVVSVVSEQSSTQPPDSGMLNYCLNV